MSKKNKLLQRISIVMLLMLTLCFGFVPDANAATKDTTVEASIASNPVSKAAPAAYLTSSSLTFGSERASKTTRVMYASISRVKSNATWITTWYNGDTVTVDVAATTSASSRTGSVTVTLTTGKTLTISVKQYGIIRVKSDSNGAYVDQVSLTGIYPGLPTATVDAVVTVESELAITATDTYSWISTSVVGKKVYIYLSPNYNVNARSGSITISNGYSKKTLRISQSAYIPDYLRDWSSYFGYYSWEQSIKNSSNMSTTKTSYKNLVNVSLPTLTKTTSSDKKYTYYSSSLSTEDRKTLKRLVDALMKATCKAYGIPEVTIVFYSSPVIVDNTTHIAALDCGGYIHDYNMFEINEVIAQWDILRFANTVFHEMRHKWQHIQARQNGSFVQYLMYYNFAGNNYLDPNVVDLDMYKAQVVERDARKAAEIMARLCK